jgi:hypothetical protein
MATMEAIEIDGYPAVYYSDKDPKAQPCATAARIAPVLVTVKAAG